MGTRFPIAETISVFLVVVSVMSIHSLTLRKIPPSRTAKASATSSLLVSLFVIFQLIDENIGFAFLIPFAIATYFVIYIDIQTQRIPNFINLILALTMTIAVVVWRFFNQDWQIFPIIIGGVTLFIIYFGLNLVSRNRLGMGDVKLAYAVGMASASFGISGMILATLFAFALSGMFALGLLVSKKANLKSEFAFGPFMIAGTWLSLLMLSSFL